MAEPAPRTGLTSRWACLAESARNALPGAADRRRQVAEYKAAWEAQNAEVVERTGPRWVALGDSAAQGVGASRFDRGYVGQLLERLRVGDDPAWQVVNLSVSGARTADVIDGQLPHLEDLAPVALVTCAVGGNDLLRSTRSTHERQLDRLMAALPPGAIVATLPQGLRSRRARALNQVIVDEAPCHGLVVADLWGRTGPPWQGKYGSDHFHPSDAGHADWADAFAAAIGLTIGVARMGP